MSFQWHRKKIEFTSYNIKVLDYEWMFFWRLTMETWYNIYLLEYFGFDGGNVWISIAHLSKKNVSVVILIEEINNLEHERFFFEGRGILGIREKCRKSMCKNHNIKLFFEWSYFMFTMLMLKANTLIYMWSI